MSAKLQTFGAPFRSDQIGLSELGRNDAARLGDLPSTAMALFNRRGGNPEESGERLVELEDQKDRARHRE
jgi:hypothetical protein